MESLAKHYPSIQRFLSLCIELCMSNLLCVGCMSSTHMYMYIHGYICRLYLSVAHLKLHIQVCFLLHLVQRIFSCLFRITWTFMEVLRITTSAHTTVHCTCQDCDFFFVVDFASFLLSPVLLL